MLTRREFDASARGALEGVRVVDLSRLVAGNMLTKVLADHGAEVIKVEPPAGDSLRAWKVGGIETSWKTWCRNKRSLCLDLRQPDAIAIIKRLVEDAAMLVESFRPGVLEEMGLAPATLHAINPRLVIARISGWGQTGPFAHKPGFGTLVEGYSGFAAINGFEDREPVLPPMFMADAYAGLYGAATAMIALRHAEATGQGQVMDLSLFEPIFTVLEPQMANHRITGKVKPRTGSRSTNTAPRNAYRTKDGGWVGLSSSTQAMFVKLMRSIGRPELVDDPRFRTNADRIRHLDEIDGVVRDAIAELTMEQALAQFDRDGVTIGPIMDVAGLAQDRYVAGREALIEVPDEEMPGGWLPTAGETARLSATPGIQRNPAPALGQDNDALLAPLLGEAELARLRAAGVVLDGGRNP
ncbi:CaiB/BaiF CoA transferase family protein [Roseococcus suduntuyensis]|uniref:Crotonobetainyl-CoA:carnitine CoA-transferase CaiB-like acyl-CoA transferase n=1 Tax=Roseococcus suduntuyensis TaxID=455361 RepID=A0A840AAB3_9PROT|nr:CoA transferase [Roseococcus suduntuyensis]MBB3897456.1 crotonobetainyl-CoA:carnitine CoA-transferase CaiB-like acyl-CoA transferase [Roseococcus suduntuyensis]